MTLAIDSAKTIFQVKGFLADSRIHTRRHSKIQNFSWKQWKILLPRLKRKRSQRSKDDLNNSPQRVIVGNRFSSDGISA